MNTKLFKISSIVIGAVLLISLFVFSAKSNSLGGINHNVQEDFAAGIKVNGTEVINSSGSYVGALSGSTAALSSTLTVTGATALNGGLTMDTNKFSVADTSGNTLIAGTLGVTGTTTLATSTGIWYAADSTAGLTASCASTTALTVKNGLITACN